MVRETRNICFGHLPETQVREDTRIRDHFKRSTEDVSPPNFSERNSGYYERSSRLVADTDSYIRRPTNSSGSGSCSSGNNNNNSFQTTPSPISSSVAGGASTLSSSPTDNRGRTRDRLYRNNPFAGGGAATTTISDRPTPSATNNRVPPSWYDAATITSSPGGNGNVGASAAGNTNSSYATHTHSNSPASTVVSSPAAHRSSIYGNVASTVVQPDTSSTTSTLSVDGNAAALLLIKSNHSKLNKLIKSVRSGSESPTIGVTTAAATFSNSSSINHINSSSSTINSSNKNNNFSSSSSTIANATTATSTSSGNCGVGSGGILNAAAALAAAATAVACSSSNHLEREGGNTTIAASNHYQQHHSTSIPSSSNNNNTTNTSQRASRAHLHGRSTTSSSRSHSRSPSSYSSSHSSSSSSSSNSHASSPVSGSEPTPSTRLSRNLQSAVTAPNQVGGVNHPSGGGSSSSSSSSTGVGANPVVHSEDNRPLAIRVRNLPARSSDTSLKDGLFHEYKKHGKVTWVKVVGQNSERYALVCFKKPDDVEKALEVSHDKLFFGCKIEVEPYQGYDVEDNEFRPYEAELDEYHPKSTRTLFIGNLEKEITASELRGHFECFGEIIEIDIKKQGMNAYAFCQYSDIVSVVKAMRKMDGEHLGNNRIKLGFGKSMPTNCVWIDGVGEKISESHLQSQFSRYGTVTKVIVDRMRQLALVLFDQIQYAQTAVKEMRGATLRGRKLQVDFASRECQDAFYEKLEKQSAGSRFNRYDSQSRSRASSFSRHQNSNDGCSPSNTPGSSSSSGSGITTAPTLSSAIVAGSSAASTSSNCSLSSTVGGAGCTLASVVAQATPMPGSTTPARSRGSRSSRHTMDYDYMDTRRFRSYDEYSQGSGASHDEDGPHSSYTAASSGGGLRSDSPLLSRLGPIVGSAAVAAAASLSVGSESLEVTVNTSSITGRRRSDKSPAKQKGDIRILQKERSHLLEQLEECPSSGDESIVSPRKRIKIDHHHLHNSSGLTQSHLLDPNASTTLLHSGNVEQHHNNLNSNCDVILHDSIHRKSEVRRLSECNSLKYHLQQQQQQYNLHHQMQQQQQQQQQQLSRRPSIDITATIAASCSGGILGGGSSTNSLRHGSTSSTSSSSDHHTQQQLQQQHTTSSLVPSGTPASSSAMACKRRRVVGGGSGNLATTTTMIAGSSSGNSGIASSNAMLPNDDAYHQHASRGRGHQLHSHHSHEASGGESADGSRPGTPLCDERPEVLPTEPRRLPRERPHEPMVLPLPKFGIQFFQQYRNSVASATATNFHLSSSNNSSNSSLINASSSLTSSSGGAGSHMMSNSSNVINNSGSSSNCHSSLSHNTATSTATASSAHLPSPSARYPHWRPHHHHHHSHHHHHNQAGSAGVGGPSALTASPLRPRSLSSNSSDSDVAPNNSGSPSLEERIRTLDEMYERWSGGGSSSASGANIVKRHDFSQHHMPTWQLHPRLGGDHSGSHHSTGSVAGNPSSSAAARHKFLGIDVKELQPSDIVKSVLAKKSIFDDDLQRLKNINDKYEPTSDINQVSKTITGVCTSPGLPNLAATKTPVVGCTKTGSGALLQRLSSLSPMNSPQASISPYNSPSPSPSVGLGGAPNTSTVVSLAKLPAPLPGANVASASPSSASTQSTSAAHKTLQYPFPSHPPLPNTAAPSPTVQPAPPPMEQVTKPAAPPPPLPPDTSPANSNPNSASTSSLKPKMNVITKSLSVPSNKTTTGSGDSDKPSSTTTRILTKSASVPGSTNVGTIKMPISSTSSSSFDNSTAIIGNSSSSSSNNKHDEETSTPAVTPTLQTPKQGKSSNSSSTASTKKGEKTHKHNHRVDSEKKTTKAERSRKNSAVSLQTTTPRKDDEAVETTETKEVESNTEKEREKVEREKREKREKELKKQQDREERDRKEKEERERKEREQREEKERKQREERERKEREEREKKHRLESEKKERERRENEEKEECERKEREEFERKEREECERKQKEEREEKAQEERDRKDREEREKEHKVHQEAREKLQREEEKIQKSKEEREHLLRKKEILSDTSTFPLSNHVAEYFCSTGDVDKHNNKENSTDEVQLSPPPTTMNPEVPNKHRSRKPSRNSPVRLPKRRLSSQDSNNGAGSAVVVVSGGASQNSDEHAKRIRIETQQQQVDSTTSSNIKIQERRDSKEPHPKEVQSTPQRNKHHHQRQYSNSSGTHKTHSNAIEVEEKHPKTKEHLTKHKSKHHTKHQSAVAVAAAAAPLPQPEETNEPHLDTVQNCLERCPTEKLNHQQHHEDISEHENSPSSRKQMNSSDDENQAALKTPTTTQKHREHGSSHGHSRHRREKREHREKKQRHAAPAIELVNTTNSNITTDEEHIVAHNPHRRSSAAGSTTSGVETNARLKHESFSTSGSRSVERKSSRCSDEGLTLNQSQQQLYQQQQQNTPGSRAGNPRGTLSRKIILSSADSDDSEDTAAAKKHSIFDIPDEGPYVSMYDKVKARSCKNMQKQEEEKKIKAKFSQLKQSRAKREEKKRSTSYDGDSDSDFDERQHRGAGSGSGGATGSYKHGSGAQNRTPHGSGLTSTDDEENPAVLERRRRGSHSAHNAHPQRMFSDSDSTAAEAAEARRTKIQHNLLRLCDDEGDESSDIDVRPNVRRISSPSKRITIKRNSHTTPRIASDSESQSQTATDVKIKQESIKTDDEETIHGKSAYVQHIKKEPQQLDSDVDLKFKRRCSISSADDTTRLCFKTEKLPKLSAHEIKKEFENYMTETGASAADSYNSFNEHEKLPKSQQLQQSAPQRFSPEGRKKHKKSKKRQKAPQQQQQDEEQQLGLGMEATTNAHLSTIVSGTTDNYNTQTMPLDDSKCGVLTHKYDPFDELKRESTVNLTPHTNNGASDVIPSEKKRHKDRKEKKRDKLRNMSVDVGGNIEFEKTSTHTITKEERHRLKKSKKSKSIDAMRIFNSTTTTEPAERITTPNSLTLYKRSGGEKMEDIFGPISDEEGSQYSDKDLTKDSPSMSTTHNSTTINSTSITGPIASAALNPYKQEPLTPKSHTVEENEENKQKVSNSAHLERERHRKEKREKKRKEREKSREQHALATLQQQQEQTADDENSVDLDEAGRALEAQLMEDSDNKLTEDATPSTAKTYRSDMTDVFRFSDADENSMDQKFGAEQQDVADVKSSVEMQQNQLQQQQHNKIKEKKKKKKRSKEDRHQHHQRRESSSSTASQHQQQQQQHSSTMSPPTASCKLTIDVQAAVKHAQKTEKLEEEDDATTPAPICKPSPSLPCLIGDDDVLELPKPVIPPSAITTLNKSSDMLSLSPMREKHMISPIPKTPTSSHVTNEKLTPTTPVSATVADNVQTTPTSSDTCGNATKSADSSSIVTSPTVSSTSSASTKKKSEKFIPGFDGEVDEKLSESAVQSISTEFHTPSLDPSADEPKIPIESPPDASKHLMDKIEDTKSRVTISQEETESAVSALLGESFGNSFNDDVSFNDDEDDLSAVDPATVVPPEPDEEAAIAAQAIEATAVDEPLLLQEDAEAEMLKAVQSLNPSLVDMDIKADTPQSVQELQIDTDTEENADEADSSGHSLKIDENAPTTPENKQQSEIASASVSTEDTKGINVSQKTSTTHSVIIKAASDNLADFSSTNSSNISSHTTISPAPQKPLPPKIEPPKISNSEQPPVQPVHAVLPSMMNLDTVITSTNANLESLQQAMTTTTAAIPHKFTSTPVKANAAVTAATKHATTIRPPLMNSFVMQPPTISIPPENAAQFTMPIVLSPRGNHASEQQIMLSPHQQVAPPQSPVSAASYINVCAPSPHSPHLSQSGASRGNTPTRQLHSPAALSPTCPQQSQQHLLIGTPGGAALQQQQQQQQLAMGQQRQQQTLMSSTSTSPNSGNGNNSQLTSSPNINMQRPITTGVGNNNNNRTQQHSPQFNAVTDGGGKLNSSYATPSARNPPSGLRSVIEQHPGLPIAVHKMPPVPTHPTIISKVVSVPPQQAQQSCSQQQQPLKNFYTQSITPQQHQQQQQLPQHQRHSPQVLQQISKITAHQQQQQQQYMQQQHILQQQRQQIQQQQQQHRQQHHQQMQQQIMQQHQQQMLHMQKKVNQQQQQQQQHHQQPQQQPQTKPNYHLQQQQQQYHQQQQQHMLPLLNPQQHQQQQMLQQQQQQQSVTTSPLNKAQQNLVILRQQHINTGHVPSNQQQQPATQNLQTPQKIIVQQHIVGLPPIEVGTAAKSMLQQQQQQHSPVLLQQHPPVQQQQHSAKPILQQTHYQVQHPQSQQPISTTATQNSTTTAAATTPTSTVSTASSNAPKQAELENITMVATATDKQQQESLQKTESLAPISSEKLPESSGIQKFIIENVSVIRTPTPTTTVAEATISDNKDIRSSLLTEENVIKISSPKADETEQEDSKEDSDYWSAKEVNIDSVIKKVDATCIREELQQQQQQQQQEKVHTNPPPIVASSSKTSDSSTKAPPEEVDKPASEVEKPFDCNANPNVAITNTSSTTDHETEDETETTRSGGALATIGVGKGSTRGGGVTKRGRQPRGGKKQAALPQSQPQPTTVTPPAETTISGIQTRLRKPTPAATATRGRKGRPPTRHLAQQQQLLQQQQLQQQQLQQATTVGNVSVNMSPTPTSSESRKSRTTSGSSAASNSATATTAANSDQDVYEFHDDSAGEEPQVKSTGAPACTNATTASHTAGDARPRIILTIKSPGQATPIVMATEKPIATTATEQKQLQTSTTQIANSSSSSSSTHPTQQLTDSAGANILQSPQQQSIVAGTSDIAEQQIKSTPDPVPVPATNADFPNLSNVTSASGVTVSALTRKSRRLQEKDRSTIDDIIEDVVRNTQPNQAQAAAMSQIPKGAQTPPRRSGRNAVQPKKDGNISSPVVLSNTTPQSMVGRLRRPKDRKSSAEAVTTIGSHAGTSDFVEAEKNLTETVAPQIDDAPSKQQALETIHAATSIPPASVTAVEITRTPSTTQPPPTSTTTNAIIPQHPKKKALAAAEIESFSTNSSSSSISAIPTTILPPILHTASAPASQKCTGGGAADVVNKSLIDPVTGMISSMQQGKEGNLPAAAASGIHHQPQQQPHKQMPHDPKIMMQAAVTAAVAVASNENQLTESSINSTNPKTQTQLDVRAASPSNNNNNSKPQNISLPSNVSITPSVTSIATPITAPTKPIQLENAAAASLSVPSNIPTPTPTHLPNKAVSVVVKTSTAPVVIQQHLIQPQIAHQGHGHAQTPSKQQIVVQQSPQPLHAQPTGNVRPPTLKAHVLNSQKQFQQQQQQVPTTVVNQQQQQLLQQQSSAGSHVIQTNIAGRNTLQHQQQQMPLPTSQHQQLLVNIPSTHTTHAGPTMQSPRLPQQQQPSIVIKQNQPVQLQQQQQQQVVHVVGAKNSTTASPHISIQQQVVTVAHSSKQHQQHLQHQYQNQMHMPSGPMILQQQQMQTVGAKSNPITQHSILKQQQHNIVKQQQIPAGVSVVTHQQIGKQQAQQHHASQQQAQQHHAPQQQLHMKQQQQSASLGLPPGNLIGLPPHAVAAHQMAAVAANLLQSKTAHLQSQQHHTPSPPLQQQQQQHVAVKQNPMVHNLHTQNAQMMACAIGSSPPPSTTLKQQQQHNISNIQQPQQQIVATGGSGLRTTIPTISPQGQARAAPLLLPSGLPVPPFEANMHDIGNYNKSPAVGARQTQSPPPAHQQASPITPGETTFPPGPIRGVPREHIILYQQYLRGQDTMGAVPRIPYKDVAGAELDETLAGSPPLELRRPGSVPRTIAVPHSLQSPQDRATDSPQVAQVYVHNTRIPPPHPHYPEVAGRFFDVGRQLPIDPPPAHRSATAHSVVAPPPVVVPLPGAAGNSPFIGATSVQPPPPPPSVAVSTGPPTTLAHLHPKILVERERERELREREQHLQREQQQQRIGMATAGNNATTSSGVHDSNLVPAQAGRNMQVATPPHSASQGQPPPPPQADSLLTLLQRYPVMWQGLLALKTDQAAVQMHFVFGNPNVARASLPCNSDGTTPPLRIAQRMRLEQTQLEGVAKKMQFENEHCMLLALPCGRDHADVLQQSRNLQTGFITYLQQKMAAGIVNIPVPGSEQAAYVVHIFPSCDFANENLERAAPDLKNRVAEIAHLLIVIATV